MITQWWSVQPATVRRFGDVAAAVLLAALFRSPPLLTDFWFDEIYSYERFAREARSLADIFFASTLKHDNNHHLNTVVLYLLGEQTDWVVYRLPGTVCGLVAVAAVVLIGQRRGRLDGLLAGLLVGTSYLMAVYSTEARGYAWLLGFAAIGFLALDSFLARGERRDMLLFWGAIAAGLAAHPAILHFYLGALLWSGYRLRARRRDLLWLHAGPVVWIALWVVFITRGSVVGGGPSWTWNQLADQAFSWTFGYPLLIVPPLLAVAAACTLVVWDARRTWMEGSDQGLFFVGTIVGPVVLMAALSPPYLFPRYFVIPLFFLLLVASRRLAALARHSRRGMVAATAIVLLFLAGNSFHIATLRGERLRNHRDAVAAIAGPKTGRVLVASWSLDQWTELPLRFHATRLDLGDRIEYLHRHELPTGVGRSRVDWAIDAAQPCGAPPPSRRLLPSTDGEFVLARTFAVCGPSGMSWFLYARADHREGSDQPMRPGGPDERRQPR